MPDTSVAVMRCADCGQLDPGPRELCPACLGPMQPTEVAGAGRLVSWTVVRRPPLAFKHESAYAVAVVALDAGCQVTGRLTAIAPDGLSPGSRVCACGRNGSVPIFALSSRS